MPFSPRKLRTGRRTPGKDRLQTNAGKRYAPSLPRSSRTGKQTEGNISSSRRDRLQVSHDRRYTPSPPQKSRSDRRSDRDLSLQRIRDRRIDHRFKKDVRSALLKSVNLTPPWNTKRLGASPPRRYQISDELLPPTKYFDYSPLPSTRMVQNERPFTRESSSPARVHVDRYSSPRRNHCVRHSPSKRDKFTEDVKRSTSDRYVRDNSPRKDYNDGRTKTRSSLLSKMSTKNYSKNTSYSPLKRNYADISSKDHSQRGSFNRRSKENTPPLNRENYDRPYFKRDNERNSFRSRSNPRQSARNLSLSRNDGSFNRNKSSLSQTVNSERYSRNEYSSFKSFPRKSLKKSLSPQKYGNPSPNRRIYSEKYLSISRPEDQYRRVNASPSCQSYPGDDTSSVFRFKNIERHSSKDILIRKKDDSSKYYTHSNSSLIRKSLPNKAIRDNISVFPESRSGQSPQRNQWSSNQSRNNSSTCFQSSHYIPLSPVRTQKSVARYH